MSLIYIKIAKKGKYGDLSFRQEVAALYVDFATLVALWTTNNFLNYKLGHLDYLQMSTLTHQQIYF